jgi:tetratricopeptide (TPR) repeat protein
MVSGDHSISLITALLFGIHPLHVESVAWISERRNVLYAFFFLSSLICYLYYIKNGSKRHYYFSIVLFILSSLAKAMAIMLPFIVLLLDYLLGRKLNKNNLRDKIPLFVIAILFGLITFIARYSSKDFSLQASLNLSYNIFIMSFAFLFYILKMFIPTKLSCIYPYKYGELDTTNLIFLSSFFIVAVLIGIIIYSRKYNKKVIFGTAFFAICILPTINIIPSLTASSIVADRYFYIASIGLFYLISEFYSWIYKKSKNTKVGLYFILISLILIIVALLTLTRQRCKVWHDSITLWNDVLNNYPNVNTHIPYYNRAVIYADSQENIKAVIDFNKALMLCYKKLGIQQDYDTVYKDLLKFGGYSAVYDFLAVKFAEIDRMEEARILLNKAIQINPSNTQALFNLCSVYGNLGRYKEAIMIGEKVIELAPHSAQAHYNLSLAYFLDKQYDLACKYYKIAIELGFKPEKDSLKILEKCK